MPNTSATVPPDTPGTMSAAPMKKPRTKVSGSSRIRRPYRREVDGGRTRACRAGRDGARASPGPRPTVSSRRWSGSRRLERVGVPAAGAAEGLGEVLRATHGVQPAALDVRRHVDQRNVDVRDGEAPRGLVDDLGEGAGGTDPDEHRTAEHVVAEAQAGDVRHDQVERR